MVEVGPRDGLQNEPSKTSVEFRVELIDRLSQCGLTYIETGSFVSKKWVPQMADTDLVMNQISRSGSVTYAALVPNMVGLEAAISAKVSEIAVFVAASETFSQKNINCGINESISRLKPVAEEASQHGIPIRGYISCIVGCPYEGEIRFGQVIPVLEKLLELGCREVSLGDTIGIGTPLKISNLLNSISEITSLDSIAVHFHDTYGQALANILISLDSGVKTVDSSISGLGGCPYAKGATGNVATEDVVYMLDGLGVKTKVNLDSLISVSEFISESLDRPPTSKVARAILA